jgi:hypothetical protein
VITRMRSVKHDWQVHGIDHIKDPFRSSYCWMMTIALSLTKS